MICSLDSVFKASVNALLHYANEQLFVIVLKIKTDLDDGDNKDNFYNVKIYFT